MHELIEQVRVRYEDNGDPGHDWLHIQRVMANAKRIGEAVGANLDVVLPAALLHDIINVPKNHPDRAKASAQAAEEARQYLQGYDVQAITTAILEHSYSRGLAPSTLESAVLQDADRLDALGAVGIMRTVSCGALMRSRYYDQHEPIAHTRGLDDKANTIDHLYVKLFNLRMNTEPARVEAEKRFAFMRAFVDQLRTEIG